MKNNKNNISRFPFFYGYIIIFTGTIGVLMSAPGQTVGISVFTDFIIDELKISRENLSLAYLIGTLVSSFFLTKAGRFFDRFGARVTSVLAALFLGLSLFYLSEVSSLSGIISSFVGIEYWSAIVFILLSFGFLSTRFFGQGVLTMSSKNMVMKWFDKRRGMASAYMGIAISFGFSYSPRVFDWLISLFGWKGAWQVLALLVGIIFMLFAALSFRDNPFEFGLKPDGKEIIPKKKNVPIYHPEKDYTLKEVKATYSFWVFNLSLAMHALYGTAITFHIIDVFASAGLSRVDAIMIFLPSSIVAVSFQLVSGYVADFIKMKYLLIVEIIGMMISMIALTFLSEGFPVILLILGNGIASGLFGVVSSVTWPRFYGLKNLGAITGFNMGWIVAGSAIGPYLFSLLYNINQNYSIPALLCFVATIILLFLSFKADNVNINKDQKI